MQVRSCGGVKGAGLGRIMPRALGVARERRNAPDLRKRFETKEMEYCLVTMRCLGC
jgi:hypothetical protein